ncbi:MAG: hypothetical protein Q9170_005742 [Blastenia crenularia]
MAGRRRLKPQNQNSSNLNQPPYMRTTGQGTNLSQDTAVKRSSDVKEPKVPESPKMVPTFEDRIRGLWQTPPAPDDEKSTNVVQSSPSQITAHITRLPQHPPRPADKATDRGTPPNTSAPPKRIPTFHERMQVLKQTLPSLYNESNNDLAGPRPSYTSVQSSTPPQNLPKTADTATKKSVPANVPTQSMTLSTFEDKMRALKQSSVAPHEGNNASLIYRATGAVDSQHHLPKAGDPMPPKTTPNLPSSLRVSRPPTPAPLSKGADAVWPGTGPPALQRRVRQILASNQNNNNNPIPPPPFPPISQATTPPQHPPRTQGQNARPKPSPTPPASNTNPPLQQKPQTSQQPPQTPLPNRAAIQPAINPQTRIHKRKTLPRKSHITLSPPVRIYRNLTLLPFLPNFSRLDIPSLHSKTLSITNTGGLAILPTSNAQNPVRDSTNASLPNAQYNSFPMIMQINGDICILYGPHWDSSRAKPKSGGAWFLSETEREERRKCRVEARRCLEGYGSPEWLGQDPNCEG